MVTRTQINRGLQLSPVDVVVVVVAGASDGFLLRRWHYSANDLMA